MSRPNIVLISADQHRADCFGFQGRNIRRLILISWPQTGRDLKIASRQQWFANLRASILTGQLCRTHGVHDNGIDLDPEIGEKGFASAIAASGYDTAYFGRKLIFLLIIPLKRQAHRNALSLQHNIPRHGMGHIWALTMLN